MSKLVLCAVCISMGIGLLYDVPSTLKELPAWLSTTITASIVLVAVLMVPMLWISALNLEARLMNQSSIS